MKEITPETIVGALDIMERHERATNVYPIAADTLRMAILCIIRLEEDNKKLKNELLTFDVPRGVKRFRLVDDMMEGQQHMDEHPEGEYVTWEEFEWMANYADQLVEFSNMPCLPADLKHLRESNTELAMEAFYLRQQLDALTKA